MPRNARIHPKKRTPSHRPKKRVNRKPIKRNPIRTKPRRVQVKKKPGKRREIKTPKQSVSSKKYNPKNWITITFLRDPIHTFFPSNIFPEAINSVRMNYVEARKKSEDFWKDKKIVFHMADRNRQDWLPFYRRVIDNAKIAWIKYAAKTFMTYPEELDTRRYNIPLSFYRVIDDACDNILWELPLNYGGFFMNKNKVPLTLYDKKYEIPLKKKKIDFLGVVDKYPGCNRIMTLELMRRLSQAGYKVKVILINSKRQSLKKYKQRRIGIETVLNNKSITGQELFHKLCQESKIMVDLSFRWTYGRVVYEALFNGAISVCTNTYGASHHLFPDLIVDTTNPNIKDIYKKCVDTIERWSPELVEEYRKQARHNSSPQVFSKNLNNETSRILGEQIA